MLALAPLTPPMATTLPIITPAARLDILSRDSLKQGIHEAAAAGPVHVLVDLEGVTFIDSAGLGALVSALKTLRTQGGSLSLCAPSEQIRTLLEITSLNKIFPIYPNRQAFLDQHAGT